jgi:hypothetical protein
MKRLCFCLIAAAWVFLLIVRQPAQIADDFYPVYYGAQALLAGRDPYTAAETEALMRIWHSPHAAPGFAYPLPVALIAAPLAVLPILVAVGVWTLAGAAGAFAALGLRADWRAHAALPLLFIPLFDAIVAKQATLIWFALAVGLLFAIRARRAWLIGLLIALLPAKPQTGLFFALAGLVWAWQNDRRSLAWAAGWGALVWGGSLVLQPLWPLAWIESVKHHSALNQSSFLLPWSLVLILVTWHMPWPARVAAAQVAFFPLTSVYTMLPLLLIWLEIGGPLALVGAGISWLWLPFADLKSAALLWALVVMPLVICAWWHRRQALRRPLSEPAA